MLTHEELQSARQRAQEYLERAGIVLTPTERNNIEVADFGLSDLERTGLELVVYVNTARCCAKELVLFPRQTCPEHYHPSVDGEPGKEETFRCRWGEVYLYVPGHPAPNPRAIPPAGREAAYTVWHEITLGPGEQYTLEPDTPHWFQAGDQGAVVSEFSTRSRDEADIFRDPEIQRATQVRA
jgi:D-lyxose ketol-isomerase